MSAVLAFRDTAQEKVTGPVKRRSIQDAFNRAAKGLKPLQPHDNAELLLAEAFHGQVYLKKLGRILNGILRDSEFEIGPAKDMDRARTKMTRKGRKISENCDWARGRIFTDIEQMKTLIDIFGKRTDSHGITLSHNGEEITVIVTEVDNTFTTPNSIKPGLKNLDAKLLVPFRLKNGEETYHHTEFQAILDEMKHAWNESHDYAEQERIHDERMDKIQEALEGIDPEDHEGYTGLALEFIEASEAKEEARRMREKTNVIAARQCGADALTGYGYQPCNNNNPENVVPFPKKAYIDLVAN